MRKILLIGIIILLAGCQDTVKKAEKPVVQDHSKEIEELYAKVKELESIIGELQVIQEEKDSPGSDYWTAYNELHNRLYMTEKLVRKLPGLEIREGFVKNIGSNTLSIDFAEKVEDLQAPNNFRIVNDEEIIEEVPFSDDMVIFVLMNNEIVKEDFMPENHFFFEIYSVGGKVIQIREMYIP